jgi:hypothetical protein
MAACSLFLTIPLPSKWTPRLMVALWALSSVVVMAAVPEEYQSTGGHSLAFGGSVASGMGGASAIRANPALLSLEKEYTVSGAYHWPVAGRDFYQLGVVDGKTSAVAAGFSYTGALDHYQGIEATSESSDREQQSQLDLSQDTPVIRRASLAFALPIGQIYAGFGGSYVEARPPAETFSEDTVQKIKGFTIGAGLAAHLSPALRIGMSAENLANRKVQYAAPTFYRAGVSYFFGDLASFHGDFRRRQGVAIYEGKASSLSLDTNSKDDLSVTSEDLFNLSASVKLYDLLRCVASVGQVKDGVDSRQQVAGGLSLVNQKFSFSYQLMRPNIALETVHHALALGLEVAM